MAEEKKEEVKAPPTPPVQEPPKVEEKIQEPAKPAGLDAIDKAALKALYDRSPQMFKEAGIPVQEEKKEAPKEEPKVEPPTPQSAAPVAYQGKELVFPEDVPVKKEMVEQYLYHAKEIGLSPDQVQKEIDFQVKQYREATKEQPKGPTQAELDAANVAKLKADKEFGANYEENMEIARRAAVKYADPELLERLKTSDPVLVRHLWKIGKADSEDHTRGAPNRNGNETEDAEEAQKDHYMKRYPNSPSMFKG